MRIGILTLPFNNNYGGYLQCYALMTFLKREGHDVELIYRRHPKAPISKKIIPTIKNLIKVLIGKDVLSIFPDEEKSFRIRGKAMMSFLDEKITPKSIPLYSSKEFVGYVSGRYEAIIVGSDQVWRPEYGPGIRDYFFYGIPDDQLIRISYAASFGTDNPQFKAEELIDCIKSLAKFKGISVRESSGVTVMKKLGFKLSCEPQVVLDPTLLLSPKDYFSIINDGDHPSKGKVFCYVLDTNSEKEEIVINVCKTLDKDRYVISDIQKTRASLPSIESWLSAIRDADFVITDSYHGMVFSVIFQKDFIVCPNIKRGGSRFSSFLGSIGLESRIVSTAKSFITSSIEWNEVYIKLNRLKKESREFLKNYLV